MAGPESAGGTAYAAEHYTGGAGSAPAAATSYAAAEKAGHAAVAACYAPPGLRQLPESAEAVTTDVGGTEEHAAVAAPSPAPAAETHWFVS